MIYNLEFDSQLIKDAKPCILKTVTKLAKLNMVNNATIMYEGNNASFYFTVCEEGLEVPCVLTTERPKTARVFKKAMTYARILNKINIFDWMVLPFPDSLNESEKDEINNEQ